jgi:hypothetical protein
VATRTLYVSDEDEQVWLRARAVAGESTESLSKLATEGLRVLIASREAEEAPDLSPANIEETFATKRFAAELRSLGWERAARAFIRACLDYGAASPSTPWVSSAFVLARRHAAVVKAHATKGVAGRQAAARKARATRKARAASKKGR